MRPSSLFCKCSITVARASPGLVVMCTLWPSRPPIAGIYTLWLPGSGGSRVYGPPGMCVRVRVTDLSSHLQNGCHRPSDEGRGVKHASVMVTEGIGTTCNHSWLTLGVVDFPLGPPRGRSGPSRRPSGLSSQLKIRRQDELQLYRSVPSCLE